MSEFERSVPNSTPRSPIRQGSVPNSTGIGPQFDSSVPNSTGIGPQFDSSGSQFDSYRYLFERSVLIPSVPNSYPPVPIPGSGPWRMPSYTLNLPIESFNVLQCPYHQFSLKAFLGTVRSYFETQFILSR